MLDPRAGKREAHGRHTRSGQVILQADKIFIHHQASYEILCMSIVSFQQRTWQSAGEILSLKGVYIAMETDQWRAVAMVTLSPPLDGHL